MTENTPKPNETHEDPATVAWLETRAQRDDDALDHADGLGEYLASSRPISSKKDISNYYLNAAHEKAPHPSG